MRGARGEKWIGEEPGSLPWWRLGRPPKSEFEDPEDSGTKTRRKDADRQMVERPHLTAEEFLQRGVEILGISLDDLAGRSRSPQIARVRELLAVVGVERYGLLVKDLAHQLNKHHVTTSGWVMRGVKRRHEDQATKNEIDRLDQALISGSSPQR